MDEVVERHHGRRPELRGLSGGGGADLISALPTDLLLQVLVRLRCARAAARTGVLSRRWRGLWSRLPDLTFRDVAPGPLLAVLSSLGPGGASLSLLDIRVPLQHRATVRADQTSSLLRAAARLSPAALRFATSQCLEEPFVDVDLSHYFQRAASIELRGQHLRFADPRWEPPALESLSLAGCLIDLAVLIPLCPRLRVLRAAGVFVGNDAITVLSSSLQELVVESNSTVTHHIHVEAPLLKQLMMSFHISGELNVSISAPMLEKVTWRCLYSKVTAGLGLWGLSGVRLLMEESNVQWVLPRVHVLCLLILAKYSHSDPNEELRFAEEIEKHMITDFSTLELHLTTLEHAFGAFLLRLLRMHRIRTATRSLKISLHRFEVCFSIQGLNSGEYTTH
uniref:F-box domain-containing protein n=1 Tax=Aegilops tauschii TaxID=37682 RepID=N1R2G3_AEGTA